MDRDFTRHRFGPAASKICPMFKDSASLNRNPLPHVRHTKASIRRAAKFCTDILYSALFMVSLSVAFSARPGRFTLHLLVFAPSLLARLAWFRRIPLVIARRSCEACLAQFRYRLPALLQASE